MDSAAEYWHARALLEWQVDMGVDEAISDAPVNRYALPDTLPKPAAVSAAPQVAAPPSKDAPRAPPPPIPEQHKVDAVAVATAAASRAETLADLRVALGAFEHCELKKGARKLVFSDGNPAARLMVVGEAPGREEDLEGRPFVGRAGQLLDKMLAAIDLDRTQAEPARGVYLAEVVPWRPPSDRPANAEEIAMLLPFLTRHIQLVKPEVIVLMGNTPCQALLGQSGITRLRGTWVDVLGIPTLPMSHPADLIRTPAAKRDAWADLLSIKARLKHLT